MSDLACLVTTVRNVSGAAKTFGFLGKHGKRLSAGEQYTERGDLAGKLAGNRRKFDALQTALSEGWLAIASTPAPHLYDPVQDVTKVLTLSGGTLGKADPCWGAYHSLP